MVDIQRAAFSSLLRQVEAEQLFRIRRQRYLNLLPTGKINDSTADGLGGRIVCRRQGDLVSGIVAIQPEGYGAGSIVKRKIQRCAQHARGLLPVELIGQRQGLVAIVHERQLFIDIGNEIAAFHHRIASFKILEAVAAPCYVDSDGSADITCRGRYCTAARGVGIGGKYAVFVDGSDIAAHGPGKACILRYDAAPLVSCPRAEIVGFAGSHGNRAADWRSCAVGQLNRRRLCHYVHLRCSKEAVGFRADGAEGRLLARGKYVIPRIVHSEFAQRCAVAAVADPGWH